MDVDIVRLYITIIPSIRSNESAENECMCICGANILNTAIKRAAQHRLMAWGLVSNAI